MSHSMTRRDAWTRTLVAFAAPGVTRGLAWGYEGESLGARLAELEKRSAGRLGCAVLNTSTGAALAHRAHERFPMCSTFKASAVAFVLQRAERRAERLDRRVAFSARDNTAANLLLASFGGPAALTKFWRSIGDTVTRLDGMEPEMNEGTPGDPRDTTSPAAMLENPHKFVLGDVLRPASREMLSQWLAANTTGDARLRAGLPRNCRIGDKTGTGGHGTTNDIAVIWPSNRKPFVVAAYLTQGPASDDARNAVWAEVGRAVAHEIASAE